MKEPTLLFDVMDIKAETKKILESIEDPTVNMLPNEKAAYEMGVCNTLAALKTLLYFSGNHPLHHDGMHNITEMDAADFKQKVENDLMEYLSGED